MTDTRDNDSTDGRIERAKDAALGSHKGPATTGDEIGEAAGGISGVLVGAGIGAAGGPVGILLGGIAGALTGWWSGRAVSEAASALTEHDDAHYRSHFDTRTNRPANHKYDDARGAYYLGHIAANNPNFTAREFDEVEPELERGWTGAKPPLPWSSVRDYAAEGYGRGRPRADGGSDTR